MLQLLVFSSFYNKKDLFKNTCFLIIYHHGVLLFIQQLCHIITIFDIINVDLLLIIIGSLLNSTYIGSVLFVFLLTLNRFDVFYNIKYFFKGDQRILYLFGIVLFYSWIVALFVFYLIPRFRMTYYTQIYQWQYIHPLRCQLGIELENKTIYFCLGMSFIMQILLIVKIFTLRCQASKKKILVARNLKIFIYAFLSFATTAFLEVICSEVLVESYQYEKRTILCQISFILSSVSNSIFIFCFVKDIRSNMSIFKFCKKSNKIGSIDFNNRTII
uniref:G_PROTEIN_RECEP_F1_2 domain-containing protein n=1 Tax=Strongyloides papillosus TaxID=174720 RepID=A0A0N5BGH2_STREA